MFSKSDMQKEKNLLLNISDLLLEKGLITEKERNAMKSIIVEECR
jgi:transcriptional regulator CtsR